MLLGHSLPSPTAADPVLFSTSPDHDHHLLTRPYAMSPATAAITQAALAAMQSSAVDPLPSPALALDDMYLPAFHTYDQHAYDLATNPDMRRQERLNSLASSLSGLLRDDPVTSAAELKTPESPTSIPPALLATAANLDPTRQAEIRRQIHIQSEQKRRAQIKDGFEDLRRQLPNTVSKKVSKAVILSRTTHYLQQLKQHASQLQQDVDRLNEENARLRMALQQHGGSVEDILALGTTTPSSSSASAVMDIKLDSIFPMTL